jgi:hypothetical protein
MHLEALIMGSYCEFLASNQARDIFAARNKHARYACMNQMHIHVLASFLCNGTLSD